MGETQADARQKAGALQVTRFGARGWERLRTRWPAPSSRQPERAVTGHELRAAARRLAPGLDQAVGGGQPAVGGPDVHGLIVQDEVFQGRDQALRPAPGYSFGEVATGDEAGGEGTTGDPLIEPTHTIVGTG